MKDIPLQYAGQRRSSVSGHYLLGNGYRGFNPILKRFAGQDSYSPFGAGGLMVMPIAVGTQSITLIRRDICSGKNF